MQTGMQTKIQFEISFSIAIQIIYIHRELFEAHTFYVFKKPIP